MDEKLVEWVRQRKKACADISDPPSGSGAKFIADATPWTFEPEIALPCATQNELDGEMAQALVDGGVMLVAEGANMPLTAEATDILDRNGVLHAPGKASNAGGVAVSGLEMSQMSHRRFEDASTVDAELKTILRDLHGQVYEEGRDGGHVSYHRGANIAAYRRLADAIVAQGII